MLVGGGVHAPAYQLSPLPVSVDRFQLLLGSLSFGLVLTGVSVLQSRTELLLWTLQLLLIGLGALQLLLVVLGAHQLLLVVLGSLQLLLEG